MSRAPISDEDLIAQSDVVTIWVACPPAPKDTWSLVEALAWATAHHESDRITLFRPPGTDGGAAWIAPEQIRRLALLLHPEAA
jgi:hypothetical protein